MMRASLHNFYRRTGFAAVEAARGAAALLPFGLNKRRSFWRHLKFLRESQWKPPEWHVEYQEKRLRLLMDFVSRDVPFYIDILRKENIAPDSIRNLHDLAKLPVISRSTLKNNLHRFLPGDAKLGPASHGSGAVSKTASGFPVEKEAAIMEEALIARHWENCGYELGQPVIYLTNSSSGKERDPYVYDGNHNRHCFDVSLLTAKNLSEYCRKLKATDADFIFGYPSALEILADSMIHWGIEFDFLGVMSARELLTDTARAKIEEGFGAKVYDWYGLSFPAASMGQCHYCEGYHLFSEGGILELVDFDGNPVTRKGTVGRMVVTNLTNHAMPLIRYDTGDLGVYCGEPCRCGRGLPRIVEKIPGRTQDLLISDDGRYIEPGSIYALFSEFGIPAAKFQIIQNDRGSFSIKLVQDLECREEIISRLKKALAERIGGEPEIAVEVVDKIEAEGGEIISVTRKFGLANKDALQPA